SAGGVRATTSSPTPWPASPWAWAVWSLRTSPVRCSPRSHRAPAGTPQCSWGSRWPARPSRPGEAACDAPGRPGCSMRAPCRRRAPGSGHPMLTSGATTTSGPFRTPSTCSRRHCAGSPGARRSPRSPRPSSPCRRCGAPRPRAGSCSGSARSTWGRGRSPTRSRSSAGTSSTTGTTASTALRQPVAEALPIPVPYGLLSLLGVRPALVQDARAVNLIYQFWIHTEVIRSIGPLEKVFNSPAHHRVHHGSNREYLDRNHGSILILWDRLFGTFEPEADQVVYGLTTNIDTFSPLRIATHEWAGIARD